MATKFDITISAVDKATGTIRRINQAMGEVLRPAQQVGRATRALASEAWQNPMVRGVRKIGAASWWAASKVTAFVAPLASLAGVGTVAGMAKLADVWGSAGVKLDQLTKRTGLAARQILGMRGAAVLAGLGADSMDGALVRLGDTLQDALYGRNQQALMMLGRLGIQVKRTSSGAVDAKAAMLDLADAIARVPNPQTQAVIARAFGLEEMLPILQRGASGIRGLVAQTEAMGAADVDAAAAKTRLGQASNRAKVAASALGDALAKSFVGDAIMRGIDTAANGMQRLANSIERVTSAASGLDRLREGTAWMQKFFGGGVLSDMWAKVPGTPAWAMEKARVAAAPAAPAAPARRAVVGRIAAPAAPAIPAAPAVPAAPATGVRLPRGLRQNNPGNLRYAGQAGATPVGGFAAFTSPQAGLVAMAKQLNLYGKRGIATINDLIGRYAPPTENDTRAYVAAVSKRTGYAPQERINLRDPEVLKRIMPAMIRQEQGQQPFDAQAIGKAVAEALAKQPPPTATVRVEAAPGVSARTRTDSGGGSTTRIAYSLPGVA